MEHFWEWKGVTTVPIRINWDCTGRAQCIFIWTICSSVVKNLQVFIHHGSDQTFLPGPNGNSQQVLMKKLTLEGKDHLMHVCLPSVEFTFGKWGSESSQENWTSLQLNQSFWCQSHHPLTRKLNNANIWPQPPRKQCLIWSWGDLR